MYHVWWQCIYYYEIFSCILFQKDMIHFIVKVPHATLSIKWHHYLGLTIITPQIYSAVQEISPWLFCGKAKHNLPIPSNMYIVLLWFVVDKSSGPWFNIKMSSYQYWKSHCGDKTIWHPSYLHNGISYTGKTASLYWIRPLFSTYSYDLFTHILQVCFTSTGAITQLAQYL